MYSKILGTGSYLPQNVRTNSDLEKMVDTSNEWIIERTGIRERRIASEKETTSYMGYQAALKAIEASGLTAQDIDLILVGTSTAEYAFPTTACQIQNLLGCRAVPAFDFVAACSGFVYGLSIADQYIRCGTCRNVLVIGVEEVVATQLKTESVDLPAEGDVVQHIGIEREGVLVIVRGAARTRGLHSVTDIPVLPLGIEKQVTMVARDVDELLAVDALSHCRLALICRDGVDVVARQGDLPIPLHESRAEVVFDATREDLGHVLRLPIAVETGLPLYPILHPRAIAANAQVELEGTFLQAVFEGEVDGATVFGQQVGVAAWVPIEVVK